MIDYKTLGLHAACVMVIVICFVLSQTVLKATPELGVAAVGAGFFLWGKLGFKPAERVLTMLIARLEPAEVMRLTSQLPPANPSAPVVVVDTPLTLADGTPLGVGSWKPPPPAVLRDKDGNVLGTTDPHAGTQAPDKPRG